MTRLKVKFSKNEKEVGNMRVLIYQFPGKEVKKVVDNYQLSEERQSEALDKIINAHPDYLDLPKEEQHGLIVSTLTMETLVYWLVASGQLTENPTMYNAYMDSSDMANIEFFFINDEENAEVIRQAFAQKQSKVVNLPKKAEEAPTKNKKATIHSLKKDEVND